MPRVVFTQKGRESVTINARIGQSLLDAARENDIDLMGNCDGAMACGSCHVIIDDEWLSKIEKPCEQEEDVLDIVFGVTQNSRLGCQVFISDEIDGIVVQIP